MSTQTYCDVCGANMNKELASEDPVGQFLNTNIASGYSVEDMCSSCYGEVLIFVNKLKKKLKFLKEENIKRRVR